MTTSRLRTAALSTAAAVLALAVAAVHAHGPKGHGGQSFTALNAVTQGVELFDRLAASGKLEESWETGLLRVEVASKGNETVVTFTRKTGDPRSLYIFFDPAGQYTGSNFTGE